MEQLEFETREKIGAAGSLLTMGAGIYWGLQNEDKTNVWVWLAIIFLFPFIVGNTLRVIIPKDEKEK